MAEFKLQAGAKLDLLNKGELRDELASLQRNWVTELARGIKFRKFSAFADVDGSGNLVFGLTGEQTIGPSEGFVWTLTRIAVTEYDAEADTLALYINDVSPSNVVYPSPMPSYYAPGTGEILLYPGDRLVLAGGGFAASARVWVTGAVREAPVSLAWKL